MKQKLTYPMVKLAKSKTTVENFNTITVDVTSRQKSVKI